MHIFCIDVGAPRNIGWADEEGQTGSGDDLAPALAELGRRLAEGQRVAIGFEAPTWTPRRADLAKITGSRGGAEAALRRPWSAGAGCGVLAAGLALMPWCFAILAATAGPTKATTQAGSFKAWSSGLFIWEALVTGTAKGLSHHADAAFAVAAFRNRLPHLRSDIPKESALNHAAVALSVAGFEVNQEEVGMAGVVVAVGFTAPLELA